MILKYFLAVLLAFSLSFTASAAPKPPADFFRGESVSYKEPDLRYKIMLQIASIENRKCQDIQSVHAAIVGKKPLAGDAVLVQEIWTVSACSKRHIYEVNLRRFPYGTAIAVGFNPNRQPKQ